MYWLRYVFHSLKKVLLVFQLVRNNNIFLKLFSSTQLISHSHNLYINIYISIYIADAEPFHSKWGDKNSLVCPKASVFPPRKSLKVDMKRNYKKCDENPWSIKNLQGKSVRYVYVGKKHNDCNDCELRHVFIDQHGHCYHHVSYD